MDFKDTLEYMYKLLPMYQRVGNSAFKKDLSNTLKLCQRLNNPQDNFKSIHIAGTNGKGSSAHMLASILQTAAYKTGLYTSPHLKSFTERIKIDGHDVEEQFVCEFIERIKKDIESIQPSFFEITVAMAFDYFSRNKVDVAVIEVGLGGRFDSTNIINPMISLITSIGLDHIDMLGETLPEIAFEKAGIIKENVPVVISETQAETTAVFLNRAEAIKAPIYFAEEEINVSIFHSSTRSLNFQVDFNDQVINAETDLPGEYQVKNIPGVMKVIDILNEIDYSIDDIHIIDGLKHVIRNTGLQGRWQTINEQPLTICDTVHNEAGVKFLIQQINKISYKNLHIIWGAVDGKELSSVFQHLPKNAYYYFCEASIPRALSAEKLKLIANDSGCKGAVIKDVNEAIIAAKNKAGKNDLIFIGGSNFIIAEINNL